MQKATEQICASDKTFDPDAIAELHFTEVSGQMGREFLHSGGR